MRRTSGARSGATGWVLPVVCLALAGCPESTVGDGDGDVVADRPVEVVDVPEETVEPAAPPIDILVLVDNSAYMGTEGMALTQVFPLLLDELVHPTDGDGDGELDHPPVNDLRLGVVTQDLGACGYPLSSCEDDPIDGDDGCLQHAPNPIVPACGSDYPTWLSWRAEEEATYSVERLGGDFTCLATFDTAPPRDGCGIEQPLESLRRALTTQLEPGGCNEGFLRPDSLLVLIVLTDEDDTSIDPDHCDLLDPERTDELGPLNIRPFLHPEMLVPVEQFVETFRALRPEGSNRLVVGMLVGVPPLDERCRGPGDELDACLALPEMQERVDPAVPSQLVPSCNTSMGLAMPPVRLVRLARQLGEDAYVGSQCETDYRGTIRGITDAVVARLRAE